MSYTVLQDLVPTHFSSYFSLHTPLFSITSAVLNYFLKQAMQFIPLHVCRVVTGVYAMSSPSSWPFLFFKTQLAYQPCYEVFSWPS